MNSKLEVLEHLLSLYEGIPSEYGKGDYLISNGMGFGLCHCINQLAISEELKGDVQILLYEWVRQSNVKLNRTGYFWLPPLTIIFYEDMISRSITPRINCLKELIKIVSDGTE